MPTSHSFQLNEIVMLIKESQPKSVLDVGVGFGKYGFLAREFLDLWDGREKYSDWRVRVDGIEVFEEYLTPVHKFVYNKIHIGNALETLPKLKERYDLILLIDVVEHVERDEAIKLLKQCAKIGRDMIISTPKDIGIQTDSFDNHFETHKFQWQAKDIREVTQADYFCVPNRHSFIYFVGPSATKIERTVEDLIVSGIKAQLPPLPGKVIRPILRKQMRRD